MADVETEETPAFEVRNTYRFLLHDDSIPDVAVVFGDDDRADLVLDELGNDDDPHSIWLSREAALKLAELILAEFA